MQANSDRTSSGRSQEIADGIFRIDTEFQRQPHAVAAYLVVGTNGLGLVETGPATVRETLVAGIEEAGYDIRDVDVAIVTHIHLDHSGGLGGVMREHGGIHALVHPVGLPHLVDPQRLLKSAARIYGDRMDDLWGEVTPVPSDHVGSLKDRKAIDIGGRRLTSFFTPGHASHHVALLDEQTGSLFTGDVAGVRMPGTSFVVPPLPPPDIDLEAWRSSIALMRSLAPERLVLTHFGAFTDVDSHLDTLSANLDDLMQTGRDVLLSGGLDEELTERLEAWERAGLGDAAERVWGSVDAANPMFMTSMGIRRILRKAGELPS